MARKKKTKEEEVLETTEELEETPVESTEEEVVDTPVEETPEEEHNPADDIVRDGEIIIHGADQFE